MISFLFNLTYVARRANANARGAIIGAIFTVLGAGLSANAQTLTLVAFGDSLTQGYGLPAEQGFVPQLQAYLTAAGDDVIVINAGVSGDTTAGGAARIDWTLTPDVDAVIVNLGGNDLLRGLPPSATRENMDKIAATIAARGLPMLIVAQTAPLNYGGAFKTEFDAIYPEVAAKYGADITPPYFTPLTGGSADPLAAMAFMQDDATHPNAEGVAKLVAGHGPQIRALLEKARAK
ncbi:MAG: arylesterase [Cypionkella sp.]|nr:arylesterase [Cypionkella sp.]